MNPRYIISLLLFFVLFDLAAQKTDSVKYTNGFLYYHEYGKGKPIILLSGGPGNNCSQLSGMANVLAKNYRVILLEQRGTGLSNPVPLDSTTINLSTAVSDINLLLGKLNLNSAIICGHSWGGTLAMYFASAYPEKVKSLILIDPGTFSLGTELYETFYYSRLTKWGISERKLIDSLIKKQGNNIITNDELRLLKYTQTLAYVSNKERLDSLYTKMDVPVNKYTQGQMFKEASKSKVDFRQSLRELKSPVSIICGRQDFLSYVSYELKIAFPAYKLYWIQDCGHFPMFEQPEIFYATVKRIIDNIK